MISMFKGSLLLFLLSFCNSYIVKKSVCNNYKLNILRPNKKGSYCRISGCAYEKKRNLIKPNPVEYPDIKEPDTKEPDTKEPDTKEPDTKEPDKELVAKIESEIESEIDNEINKLCENYDTLIEHIETYKKLKIKKFIRKVYESVNKQLDEYN